MHIKNDGEIIYSTARTRAQIRLRRRLAAIAGALPQGLAAGSQTQAAGAVLAGAQGSPLLAPAPTSGPCALGFYQRQPETGLPFVGFSKVGRLMAGNLNSQTTPLFVVAPNWANVGAVSPVRARPHPHGEAMNSSRN